MKHPVKEIKVNKLLGEMLEADKELYEKIMDTPGFAFSFNELVMLAMEFVVITPPIKKMSIEQLVSALNAVSETMNTVQGQDKEGKLRIECDVVASKLVKEIDRWVSSP